MAFVLQCRQVKLVAGTTRYYISIATEVGLEYIGLLTRNMPILKQLSRHKMVILYIKTC